ncbi:MULTISPECIES: hypothetical protein [Enterobacter]|uniref:hypothetical protein n=1 Tax=Enterobacter TaxID=547 RepID=UPI000F865EA4|nr:hypothetical protein [Enterobacter sp. WCHEn090032]RTN95721.1 hypothetical protein EKN83_12680 [Enterobacter sp. WCHEn090032]
MADLKIVSLSAKKNADLEHHRTEVIRLLEEALQAAKEGNYRSMAVLLINDSGEVLDAWHSGGLPYVMLGAMESLKCDFINLQIERR